jgi:hypothetical protein
VTPEFADPNLPLGTNLDLQIAAIEPLLDAALKKMPIFLPPFNR